MPRGALLQIRTHISGSTQVECFRPIMDTRGRCRPREWQSTTKRTSPDASAAVAASTPQRHTRHVAFAPTLERTKMMQPRRSCSLGQRGHVGGMARKRRGTVQKPTPSAVAAARSPHGSIAVGRRGWQSQQSQHAMPARVRFVWARQKGEGGHEGTRASSQTTCLGIVTTMKKKERKTKVSCV